MYHDYAISQTLFHWQIQYSARSNSGRGLGYITQQENLQQNKESYFLFVRDQGKDENCFNNPRYFRTLSNRQTIMMAMEKKSDISKTN